MEFVYYTGRGLPPYLSQHSLASLQLCLGHFYEGRNLFKRTSLQEYTGNTHSKSFLMIKDAMSKDNPIQGGTKHSEIIVSIPKNTKITIQEYMSFAQDTKTQYVLSFAEEAVIKSGYKRAQRSARNAVLALDECLTYPISGKLLGNVQGGNDIEARVSCLKEMIKRNIDGVWFGGFYADDHGVANRDIVEAVSEYLIDYKNIIGLSGPGRPLDIVYAASKGFTHFETFWPFKLAGEGKALCINFVNYTLDDETIVDREYQEVTIDLNNPDFRFQKGSLVPGCQCMTCTQHHAGYIYHLLTVQEMTAHTLLAIHNVEVFENLKKFITVLKDQNKLDQAFSTFVRNFCTSPAEY